jgi:hypothetical protein
MPLYEGGTNFGQFMELTISQWPVHQVGNFTVGVHEMDVFAVATS